MKKRSLSIFSWIALTLAVLVTAYFVLVYYSMENMTVTDYATHHLDGTIYGPEYTDEKPDTLFGGLFMSEYVDDSIPHYLYKRKEDSIKAIKFEIETRNKSLAISTRNSFIGFAYISDRDYTHTTFKAAGDSLNKKLERLYAAEKDTAKINAKSRELIEATNKQMQHDRELSERNSDTSYYISLPGYSLPLPNQFFTIGDRYYVTTVVWDSAHKTKNFARKRIPVRYSSDSKELLIPVSPGQYKIFSIVFRIFIVLIFIFGAYVLLGLPIQVLVNISRGKAFTQRNISMLRMISLSLLFLSMMNILAPYLLRLILCRYVPAEFHPESLATVMMANINWLFLGVTVFIISTAFKKGYTLQQEQDLTV